jgi:D-alanyl-D-alanine carboxypeptidase
MSRRLPLVVLLLIALGATTGVVLARTGGAPKTPKASAVVNAALGPQQITNGPITAPGMTDLLKLQLVGTTDPLKIKFKDPPRSGVLFDLETGRVIWRKDPTRVLPMASVTKMMTGLVVVNALKQGATVKITKEALAYQGSGVGVLPLNKWIGLSTMLHGLLLPSGNDAAIALAQRVSRTVPAFVAQMNLRAQAMGLSCTHYSSPSGFYDKGNHSCAADLAVEAKAVLDNPRLAAIVKRRQAVLPFPIKGGKLYLYNHNQLLKANYPGTLGIKTGYTDAAGRCLVAAVQRGKRRYGLVLLHSPDPGKQAMQLFDRAFKLPG